MLRSKVNGGFSRKVAFEDYQVYRTNSGTGTSGTWTVIPHTSYRPTRLVFFAKNPITLTDQTRNLHDFENSGMTRVVARINNKLIPTEDIQTDFSAGVSDASEPYRLYLEMAEVYDMPIATGFSGGHALLDYKSFEYNPMWCIQLSARKMATEEPLTNAQIDIRWARTSVVDHHFYCVVYYERTTQMDMTAGETRLLPL